MPEFGTAHPARDYPSAPSVDLKHDRGNCAVGDVRDRWKESELGRGHYLNRGGGTLTIQSLLKSGERPARRRKKFLLSYGCRFCEGLNTEDWSVSKNEQVSAQVSLTRPEIQSVFHTDSEEVKAQPAL